MRAEGLKILALLTVTTVLPGCVLNAGGDAPPPPPAPGFVAPPAADPATMRGYLGRPRTFAVKEGGRVDVTARRILGPDIVETATLPILAGELTVHVRPDGRLVVDELTIWLGKVELSPASVPPNGLTLVDVVASLRNEAPPHVTWAADGSAAAARGNVRVLLDWSILGVGGEVIPLSQQRIEPVPMEIDLLREGGELTAVIHAERPGVFLPWAGYMELSDLRIEIEAVE
jgi:hypothetical protein